MKPVGMVIENHLIFLMNAWCLHGIFYLMVFTRKGRISNKGIDFKISIFRKSITQSFRSNSFLIKRCFFQVVFSRIYKDNQLKQNLHTNICVFTMVIYSHFIYLLQQYYPHLYPHRLQYFPYNTRGIYQTLLALLGGGIYQRGALIKEYTALF